MVARSSPSRIWPYIMAPIIGKMICSAGVVSFRSFTSAEKIATFEVARVSNLRIRHGALHAKGETLQFMRRGAYRNSILSEVPLTELRFLLRILEIKGPRDECQPAKNASPAPPEARPGAIAQGTRGG